ncbi:MAG: DUF1015 family protein [Acidimicrobiales bacterium]
MASLAPLSVAVVEPAWAARVVSPPYDALTSDQRRAHLEANPDSFLAVTRSATDLAPADRAAGVDPLPGSVAALRRLVRLGAYGPASSRLLVYRLTEGDTHQTGVVGGLAVADYRDGLIRTHEEVDPARVGVLARDLAVQGIQSSPITVARRADASLDAAVAGATVGPPLLRLSSGDGLTQEVWELPDPGGRVVRATAQHPLYIIDGHHRAAAASRWAAAPDAPAAARWMLGVVFDAAEMASTAFHRRLPRDDPDRVRAEVAARFPVREVDPGWAAPTDADDATRNGHGPDRPVLPGQGPDELVLVARGRTYLVTVPPVTVAGDPAGFDALDTVRLQRAVLGPVLGVAEPDVGGRIEYRPALDRPGDGPVPSEDDRAWWLMRPTPTAVLLDAADAGVLMPPKSTYFAPKTRSGLLLRRL